LLLYWSAELPLYCNAALLLYWSAAVLKCCCDGVLQYYMLLSWIAGLLLY
jgi:hypothetical protein